MSIDDKVVLTLAILTMIGTMVGMISMAVVVRLACDRIDWSEYDDER